MQHYRILARLGVEPRPTGYIPGALQLSYLALGIRWYCLSNIIELCLMLSSKSCVCHPDEMAGPETLKCT